MIAAAIIAATALCQAGFLQAPRIGQLGNCPLCKGAGLRHTLPNNNRFERRPLLAAYTRSNAGESVVTRIVLGLAIIAFTFGLVAPAAAQDAAKDWPTRTVRIIIPLGAGGGGDVFTRLLAEELRKRFGQPFVVENRPGGGLNIGTRACAEATPDGYTICVLSSEAVVYNKFAFKSLPFDPEKDLDPIVNLFINANALVINSKLNVKTIPELVALRQGQARYAELRQLLVRVGLFHGPAQQEERHRHRARAVPQRQRDGQRGRCGLDARSRFSACPTCCRRSGAD